MNGAIIHMSPRMKTFSCGSVFPRMKLRVVLVLGVTAVTAALALPAFGAEPLHYPVTSQDSVVDVLHGARVPDPYRWLERLEDPPTRAWIAAQSRFTANALARLPERAAIRRRLGELSAYRRTDVPWREAGQVFFTENSGLQPQAVLYATASPEAAPRVVLDPQQISPDGSTAIGDYVVSPDGRWLAYSAAAGGADVDEIRVRDLRTGRDTPDVVRGANGGACCWTFDGGGYFYMRPPPPRPGDPNGTARVEKRLYFHRLGEPQARDRFLHEWAENYRWLYVMMSDEGRRAIIVPQRGSSSFMYVMDLGDPMHPDLGAPIVALLPGREAAHTPMGTVGDTLYVFTDLDAPRGRVIALDLREGARAEPRTVIAESPAVLQWATVAGDRLALHYLEDVHSRLRLFTFGGRLEREITLPGIGALGWPVNGRHSAPEIWYSFQSFLQPATVYRYDLRTGETRAFRAPRVPFDPSPYETKQVFYRSKDGTRVPMFVTARRGLRLDGSHPTMLTAYGGFGTITNPAYRPDLPLWLERGGVFALANIRGGGEYGEDWHRAGSLARKQSSFDDFYAAAETLIAGGWTRPARLAIHGYSNGGMLMGVALTQRPDLFAAVVPEAGHHDMLRFHRFTVGGGWIPEYGSPDSGAMFRVLRAYSPLHNVRAGTCYPATLLLTADHDDRVVPSHSYKFAAVLQAAQGCDHPILLRVAANASHSYASGEAKLEQLADMWAFIDHWTSSAPTVGAPETWIRAQASDTLGVGGLRKHP